jgi:hypothetical protein
VDPSHCTLPFGHQGWHRDDRTGARWGKEWSDPADEVREEFEVVFADGRVMHPPDRSYIESWLAGGSDITSVYRRTATTTAWVAVENEDGGQG